MTSDSDSDSDIIEDVSEESDNELDSLLQEYYDYDNQISSSDEDFPSLISGRGGGVNNNRSNGRGGRGRTIADSIAQRIEQILDIESGNQVYLPPQQPLVRQNACYDRYFERTYDCTRCDQSFTSNVLLTRHNLQVHSMISGTNPNIHLTPNRMCRCNNCNGLFPNDALFRAHNCTFQPVTSVVPTCRTGGVVCVVCSKRYRNEFLLGEHFIQEHGNFEDLGVLDDKPVDKILGFPGFDVLKYINVYYEPTKTDVDRMVECKVACTICNTMYKYTEEMYDGNDLFVDTNAGSLTDVDDDDGDDGDDKVDSDNVEYYSDGDEVVVRDDRLIDFINTVRARETMPITMTCCNSVMCYECLQRCFETNNNLVCPFCKHDHVYKGGPFVVFVEEGDSLPGAWRGWWERHVDIFL